MEHEEISYLEECSSTSTPFRKLSLRPQILVHFGLTQIEVPILQDWSSFYDVSQSHQSILYKTETHKETGQQKLIRTESTRDHDNNSRMSYVQSMVGCALPLRKRLWE